MKQVFIAATRQNDGKTMVSLGLFHAFTRFFSKLGYMKPVGQQYKMIDGDKVDKDAVLFKQVYRLEDSATWMSPITVPQGFTASYIQHSSQKDLASVLDKAYTQLSKDKDFLLIEGTGHAGVGSVFDLSNAHVAKQVGAKVVLVSLGGLGRSIDEIMLNKAVFDVMGVELAGVIINKVKASKYDSITPLIKQGLQRQGIKVFGHIPFVDMLIRPCIASIFETLRGEILTKDKGFLNPVNHCVIGDMAPHDALNMITDNALLIVPANREGLVMTVLCTHLSDPHSPTDVAGIIFTGGKKPHDRVLAFIKKTRIPLMMVAEDSFTIATKINTMLVKVRAEESEKIATTQSLINRYVDVEAICKEL